jgi:glyoxylase-like metal-dependent hydrolase (beta-lactamase superfamily II)
MDDPFLFVHLLQMKTFLTLCLFVQLSFLNAQNHYQIYAIKFAERTNKIPSSARAIGDKSGDSTGVCYMIWLLKGDNGKTILVDAGFCDPSGYGDMKFTRPDSALQKMDLKPTDITDIIVTHPHWDHVNGIDLFPKAMVWMQQDDHDQFVKHVKEKGSNNFGFMQADVDKLQKKKSENKLTLVKGDNLEILPGIKVCTGAKHTFESQYVVVGPEDDRTIIASDNAWFYYNLTSLLPSISLDPQAYVNNLKRMKAMVKNIDYIIPGHDPLLFTRFPKISDNIVKIRD